MLFCAMVNTSYVQPSGPLRRTPYNPHKISVQGVLSMGYVRSVAPSKLLGHSRAALDVLSVGAVEGSCTCIYVYTNV